jgi:lipopolysaccharide biosynthesis regulator YciM
MEFDFYWLLILPIFFGLGWLAARHEARSRSPRNGMPDAYFRGLNFLLNDQSDRAVDAFIDVVRIDPETIELHFALGKLFRRRGETDRAIRVHQNLVDRADISAELREQALFELAQDFLKAGLLDRAEETFGRLAAGAHAAAALRHRIEIAEMTRDWARAIELAASMAEPDRQDGDRVRLAQFHCEQAARSLTSGTAETLKEAREHLGRAQRVAPGHPRIRLLRGELAAAEHRPSDAIEAWRSLLADAPGYFNLIVARWIDAHRTLGRLDEALEVIALQSSERPTVELFLQEFSLRIELQGAGAAAIWAADAQRRSPSLGGLSRLLQWRIERSEPASSQELMIGQQLLADHAQLQSRHVCSHCGFRARQYYWQCPGCARWDTCSPLRAEDKPN